MRKPGKLGREKASDDDGDLLDDDGELLDGGDLLGDGGDQQTPRSGKKNGQGSQCYEKVSDSSIYLIMVSISSSICTLRILSTIHIVLVGPPPATLENPWQASCPSSFLRSAKNGGRLPETAQRVKEK